MKAVAKTVMLLRIASVLVLMNAIGHTIGGVFGKPAPGAAETAVLAMKSNRFDAMGASRTYWDFFMGYGLILAVILFMLAAVFWQLASMAKTDAARTRPLVATFCVGYFATTVLGWRYFFPGPTVVGFVITFCLLGAWGLAGRVEQKG